MLKINGEMNSSHTEAEELKESIGEIVFLHGIVYKIRLMSGFAFVILKTKRHLVQCVYSAEFAEFPSTS